MVSDGSLEAEEGDFLKVLWGFRAVTGSLFSLFQAGEAIERAKSAIEGVDTVKDLVTTGGEFNFGVRVQTSNSLAPKTAVIIQLNHLPEWLGERFLQEKQRRRENPDRF
jgi:hypothetical protein